MVMWWCKPLRIQVWCGAYRPEYASQSIKTDSHSPLEYRWGLHLLSQHGYFTFIIRNTHSTYVVLLNLQYDTVYNPGIVLFVHLDYITATFLLASLGCSALSRTLKLSQKLSSVRKAARWTLSWSVGSGRRFCSQCCYFPPTHTQR